MYWTGPVEEEGHTKAWMIFDQDSGRFVDYQVVYTNGTTIREAKEFASKTYRDWGPVVRRVVEAYIINKILEGGEN